MRLRCPITVLLLAAAIVPVSGEARAESARRLVGKGNESFGNDRFEEAAGYYDRASVKLPESAEIAFNLGGVYYRLEDYAKAREYYHEAASGARDLKLEAGAWYNLGNCAFNEGARQIDGDMEKALEKYRESVGFYSTALEKDPELSDAAHNMEIARLVIKELLDRIQKQKEQMREQEEKLKEVVDSLIVAIERQEKALGRSLELDDDGRKMIEGWKSRVDSLESFQSDIGTSTSAVRQKLDELFADQKPEPVQQASSHLDTAITRQYDASVDLSEERPGDAAVDEEQALGHMKKALEKLTQGEGQQQDRQGDQEKQDQQQQQQQDQQQQQQQAQQKNETARAILDEEKENRKKRRQQAAGGYKKVDKDW